MSGRRLPKEGTTAVARNRGPRGKSGPRGPAGPSGPVGPAGLDHSGAIATLTAQVGELVKELRIQLMRIAQIQVQLDRLASGQGIEPRNRRRLEDVES
jgi:hypothetical protein